MPEEMKVNEAKFSMEQEMGLRKDAGSNFVDVKKPTKARTGVASDLFEIAETGKPKTKKVKQICKEGDSVDRMAKSTAELLAKTSKRAIAEYESVQNNKLETIAKRTYAPRSAKKVDPEADLNNVLGSLHLF